MTKPLFVPALLASALLGAPALALAAPADYVARSPKAGQVQQAARQTPAERCTMLENQFDTVIKSHGSSALISEAKSLRSEGGQLCDKGQHIDGIGELESALWDLGISPRS